MAPSLFLGPGRTADSLRCTGKPLLFPLLFQGDRRAIFGVRYVTMAEPEKTRDGRLLRQGGDEARHRATRAHGAAMARHHRASRARHERRSTADARIHVE